MLGWFKRKFGKKRADSDTPPVDDAALAAQEETLGDEEPLHEAVTELPVVEEPTEPTSAVAEMPTEAVAEPIAETSDVVDDDAAVEDDLPIEPSEAVPDPVVEVEPEQAESVVEDLADLSVQEELPPEEAAAPDQAEAEPLEPSEAAPVEQVAAEPPAETAPETVSETAPAEALWDLVAHPAEDAEGEVFPDSVTLDDAPEIAVESAMEAEAAAVDAVVPTDVEEAWELVVPEATEEAVVVDQTADAEVVPEPAEPEAAEESVAETEAVEAAGEIEEVVAEPAQLKVAEEAVAETEAVEAVGEVEEVAAEESDWTEAATELEEPAEPVELVEPEKAVDSEELAEPEGPVSDQDDAELDDDAELVAESVEEESPQEQERAPVRTQEKPKGRSLFQRLQDRLGKTRDAFVYRLDLLLLGQKEIDQDLFEQLEELLITADLGVATTMDLLDQARKRVKRERLSDPMELKRLLRDQILAYIEASDQPAELVLPESGPFVIMVIGVNGVGKTTTIGKIAAKFIRSGQSTLLVAGDTFRAAAIDQLRIWGERVGAEVIAHQPGADPSSVVFDGLEYGLKHDKDVILIDTAGRLHTSANLMEELKKIRRVADKKLPGAPHEVLLVLDATTGQNGVSQAKLFHQAVGVSGLALTKLDGTAKGGIVANVCRELGIPVRFIGIGEQMDDLRDFDSREFVDALFVERSE